jgi:hypothetical protein
MCWNVGRRVSDVKTYNEALSEAGASVMASNEWGVSQQAQHECLSEGGKIHIEV